MNPDKLLALVMGKCWHEEWETVSAGHFRNIRYFHKCKKCGRTAPVKKEHGHPDFSDPRHRDEFFAWLCRERPEMWDEFWNYHYDRAVPEWTYMTWLFFDKDNPARPRDLMAEWLQLDETVERFGWVECQYKKEWPRTKPDGESTFFCELECNKKDIPSCNGTGKVLSEWAREVREGK